MAVRMISSTYKSKYTVWFPDLRMNREESLFTAWKPKVKKSGELEEPGSWGLAN